MSRSTGATKDDGLRSIWDLTKEIPNEIVIQGIRVGGKTFDS